MKKFGLMFLVCLLIGVGEVRAQDYNQERVDYQTNYTKYREILLEYRSARSEYLTYKTLVAQTRAVYVTSEFLIARQNVVINYLEMLAARLNSSDTYLDQELAGVIKTQINDQLEFHNGQMSVIEAAETIEDLVKISGKIDGNITTMNLIGLQSQSLVLDSRMQEYQTNTVNLLGFTTEQVRRIAKEGQKDMTDIDRWLIEAEQKYELASTGMTQSKAIIATMKTDKEYQVYRNNLRKNAQYLKETNSLLNEIIVNLKIE